MNIYEDTQLVVRVYTVFHATHEFKARDIENAREIAKRITTEGLWLCEEEGEVFYPVHQIVKARILAT
jgi:hypothetical protein